MTTHKTGSRDEWLAARKALLAKEKELTRMRDALAAERRALPWVKIEKSYVFDSRKGKVSLADLFAGRSQLMVYHFMFGPDRKGGLSRPARSSPITSTARASTSSTTIFLTSPSRGRASSRSRRTRSAWAGRLPGCRHRTTTSISISTRRSAGRSWRPGRSNTISPSRRSRPRSTTARALFFKDDDGTIYHTYSSYSRAGEDLIGAYRFLDLAPLGRNEGEDGNMMKWMHRHDEYGA